MISLFIAYDGANGSGIITFLQKYTLHYLAFVKQPGEPRTNTGGEAFNLNKFADRAITDLEENTTALDDATKNIKTKVEELFTRVDIKRFNSYTLPIMRRMSNKKREYKEDIYRTR